MASRPRLQDQPVPGEECTIEETKNPVSETAQSERIAPGRQTLVYEALDTSKQSIRLINILPTDNPDDEPVSCCLHSTELTPDLKYAAISYVWGDAHVKRDIIVNGKTLSVTTNLASALWHFRKFDMLRLGDDG